MPAPAHSRRIRALLPNTVHHYSPALPDNGLSLCFNYLSNVHLPYLLDYSLLCVDLAQVEETLSTTQRHFMPTVQPRRAPLFTA
jgi:hypothetical protein